MDGHGRRTHAPKPDFDFVFSSNLLPPQKSSFRGSFWAIHPMIGDRFLHHAQVIAIAGFT
jgi:hypothetical protein